jgi:pyruvate kinase
MLSGETAAGRYPLLAVQMLDRIVRDAEAAGERGRTAGGPEAAPSAVNDVIAAAACRAAESAGAVAICCFTLSGTTARLLAHSRPRVPIVAFSPDQSIRRRLAFYWGVEPRVMEPVKNADLMAELVSERLLDEKMVQPGDRVVLVHGSPLGVPGQTNSIRLHQIPHPSERGPTRYRVPI